MKWKDYLFFPKDDKRVIVLLSVLIVASLALHILVRYLPVSMPVLGNNIQFGNRVDSASANFHNTAPNDADDIPKTYQPYVSNKLQRGQTVDINTADTTALKMIPGIGSAYSNRIVKLRNRLGGYGAITQLREVYGMDDELYAKIKPYVRISGKPKQLLINSLDAKLLSKHPYISYKQTRVIERIRSRDRIASWDDLEVYDEFTAADIKRLKYYITFD